MFDSYSDYALEYCDGMLRDKLLEGDEEGTLEGNGTLDESQAGARRDQLDGSGGRSRWNTYARESSRVMANQST